VPKHHFNSQGRPIACVHDGDKVLLYATRVEQAGVTASVAEPLTHEQRLAKVVTLLETAGAGQEGSEAGETVRADHHAAGADAGDAPAAGALLEGLRADRACFVLTLWVRMGQMGYRPIVRPGPR
jgi:hypothetical protein